MQNVLVTGGAGFIGSNFVRFLLRQEPHVHIVNLDALTYAGSLENLTGLPGSHPEHSESSPQGQDELSAPHIFVRGDITDRDLVDHLLRQHQIDTIVHFAAESHVDRSILGPGQFIQTNIVGTFTLLDAVRQYWLVEQALPKDGLRFHHVSTDEVFGSLGPDDPAFSETTPYAPNSPYSASKASSDHLVRAYYHTYGLPVSITNCSNNYGPFQFPEKLIPLMILNALEGRPLPIYGDGQQIRDWLYVEDHCSAIHAVLKRGKLGETYNVGGDNQPANLTVVQTLCAILDELRPNSPHAPHSSLIRYVTDRPGHDRRYAMNIEKIRRELGWQPSQSLETGMLQTVAWYLEHPEWVAAIRQQQDYQGWMQQNYAARETSPASTPIQAASPQPSDPKSGPAPSKGERQ